ncbi:MAG: DUF5340 domain-containing protein [Dolichospermum sp. DET50]|jgi:hypothetical protein|nr:DUF5340 domain-containing protein [Dolichospermum sp. DET66]MBS3031822.1 DUF5340 domain-containing protein [Dolichospermum sp. DET67]MBS3037032.1 DUF5340 domain-containing protein [Dolichospermum sp. DET50]QSX69043.1 MAG: DUF5340 domain-containing protein [Dolichospermum sp. DET69]
MKPIPLPSPIHYELILQLLEKQTMTSIGLDKELRNQVNQLIITLRKAASQQKRLEETFQSSSLLIDHRWSINHFGDKVDC